MYGWIWRMLPGHWTLKLLQSAVLAVAVGGLLVVVVFPWIEPKLPFSGNTVSGETQEEPTQAPSTTAPTTRAPAPTDVPAPSSPDTDEPAIPGEG